MNRFLQSVIAMSGLFITGLLGWLTVQTQARAADSEREQARLAFIEMFTAQTSAAIRDCNPTLLRYVHGALNRIQTGSEEDKQERELYEQDLKLASDAVDACQRERMFEKRAILADGTLSSSEPPAVSTVAQNSALQVEERGSAAPEAGDRWHAVLASYQVSDEAQYAVEDVKRFRQALADLSDPSLTVAVYRTRISNHLAVVLSSAAGDRDTANRLVAFARAHGWAGDAFAQLDRGWTLCPQTDSAAVLQTCGNTVAPPSGRSK